MSEKPARLLVVDDNEMNRDMFARRLTRKGFEVTVADGAREILQRVRQDEPDLVLLDIEMPEISGLDALKALREAYSPGELPIIMVTAKNQSEDVSNALNLGASDYVTKPIDFTVALARIHTQLGLRRAEEGLRQSERRYALAAEAANDGLWDWDLANNTVYLSARWKAILGFGEDDIDNRIDEWISRIHQADRGPVEQSLEALRSGHGQRFELEYRMLNREGSFRWMLGRGLAVRDTAGCVSRIVGSQTDVTAGKFTDPVTNFPSRLLLLDRIGRLIENYKRCSDTLFAVLFLDLDNFRIVNDSLGHVAGDAFLVAVAERLAACVRSTDTVSRTDGTIARIGGDEFGILLTNLKDPGDALRVARRIADAFASPLPGNPEVFISVSMGIALASHRYDRPEDALRDAETAMHRAKALGKARFEVFEDEMRTITTKRLELETDLRKGLERGEFENYYQPIVSLQDDVVTGFEVLVRWRHPIRGILNPSEFISVAEDTGLIEDLGWQVLEQACRQAAAWHQDTATAPILNVNVSVRQILDRTFHERLATLLDEYQIAPGLLNLEITESMLIGDPSTAIENLSRIRALGVLLSVDDFGTGYSSLSYLHRFPLNTLKIDRAFVAALTQESSDTAVVRTIVTLAKALRLRVVAEGIETERQLNLVKQLGCDSGQGFYFSKPLTADHAATFFKYGLAQTARP